MKTVLKYPGAKNRIENLPAIEMLQRYDSPDVFIYADPPYLPGLRKSHLYKHEMSEVGHEYLLEGLKKHPGNELLQTYFN